MTIASKQMVIFADARWLRPSRLASKIFGRGIEVGEGVLRCVEVTPDP
jgi:hypothetical protein